jgi:hypothetical protein
MRRARVPLTVSLPMPPQPYYLFSCAFRHGARRRLRRINAARDRTGRVAFRRRDDVRLAERLPYVRERSIYRWLQQTCSRVKRALKGKQKSAQNFTQRKAWQKPCARTALKPLRGCCATFIWVHLAFGVRRYGQILNFAATEDVLLKF